MKLIKNIIYIFTLLQFILWKLIRKDKQKIVPNIHKSFFFKGLMRYLYFQMGAWVWKDGKTLPQSSQTRAVLHGWLFLQHPLMLCQVVTWAKWINRLLEEEFSSPPVPPMNHAVFWCPWIERKNCDFCLF